MKVICYSSGFRPCGVAEYHAALSGALASTLQCRTVLLPCVGVRRSCLGLLRRLRKTYARLAALADGYDVVLLDFVSRFWNGGRPVENMFPMFLSRIKKPIIMILHEWPDLIEAESHSGNRLLRFIKGVSVRAMLFRDLGKCPYDDWLNIHMFRRMSHVVVHSCELQQRLEAAGVERERISMHPLPVLRPANSPAACKVRLPSDQYRLIVLFGFPHQRKGYDLAVRSLPHLPGDTAIVLAGGISCEEHQREIEALRRMAGELGVGHRFHAVGFLNESELAVLLKRSVLCLAPFRSVTGSISISRFIAQGQPILASDLPSIRDLVNLGAGISLFEPGSVGALASSIHNLLADPEKLGQLAARNRLFVERNSFGEFARRLSAEMKRLVEPGRPRAYPPQYPGVASEGAVCE